VEVVVDVVVVDGVVVFVVVAPGTPKVFTRLGAVCLKVSIP
jgi:hypothetical protein